MMNQTVCRPLAVATILLALTAPALVAGTPLRGQARMADYAAHEAVMDSLSQVHPRLRGRWLAERGLEMPGINAPLPASPLSDSGGLRLVGKWGRGPSVEVTGRDSLVVLTLGSEAAIVSFARPGSPVVLSEIQFGSVTIQSHLRDTVLYIGGYGAVEAWDVSDPVNPVFRSRIPLGVSDFYVQDTFLYLMRQDTFRVFGVADPAAPRQLGSYRDSAVVLAASGNTVVCGHPRQGVVLVDVADPARPRRVGSVPGWALSAEVRGNLLCVTYGNDNVPRELTLRVFDISNPSAPVQIGFLNYCGGYDMHLAGQYLFISGYYTGDYGFQVVDMADSTRPRLVGECETGGQGWGVWANREAQRGYVAGRYGGLIEIDISSPADPTVVGSLLQADAAYDVAVSGNRAYVAMLGAGLHILDLSDPTRPVQLGAYDTARFLPGIETCAARDSFAFVNWFDGGGSRRYLRSVDVSDPANPTFAGDAECSGPPVDMVLDDTLLYVAVDYKLEVFNVANPRQPELVGSCGLSGAVWDLALEDTTAYVTSSIFLIISVANPANPRVIGTWDFAQAVDVVDTIAYLACRYDIAMRTLNVADPRNPRVLDTVAADGWFNDIVVVDTLAYAAGDKVRVYDVSDPRNLIEVGGWTPPHEIRRLSYAPPYFYAACYNAGVVVLEIVPTGVAEKEGEAKVKEALQILPSPTRGRMAVRLSGETCSWAVRDITGRLVGSGAVRPGQSELELNLADRPAGVYVLELITPAGKVRGRFVKQ
ncbi:MAG: hypothetical protein R6X14_02540 [bacterium]